MLRFIIILLLGVVAHETCADEPEAIVGGTPAAPGEFPYQCSMNMNNQHFCGCSILSATKILTAAHCVESGKSPFQIRIRTGSIYSQSGNTHAVKSIVMHPEYQSGAWYSWNNDIAVITLQNPIQFSAYERPVTLASRPPQSNIQCVLSGWGRTTTGGSLSPNLLKMYSSLVDNNICMKQLRITLSNSHICAFTRRGIGACQGDSGGPLVCNGEQYGITSFVMPCAQGYPDVYTSVHHHLGFIRQQMASP